MFQLPAEEKKLQDASDGGSSKNTPGVGVFSESPLPVWRNWKILAVIFGILALTAAFFAAYKLGQKQIPPESSQILPLPTSTLTPTLIPSLTDDWNTYRFEKAYQMGVLRFEIQHPKEWRVLEEEESVKWYADDSKNHLFFISWLNPDFIYDVEAVCRSGMCDKISEIKTKDNLDFEIWKPTPERRGHLSLADDYLQGTISNSDKLIVPEFGAPFLDLELFEALLSTFKFISEKNGGEKVFCQDPRPEVCTMECINNPPYICGSDEKAYCSACQACSNPEVEWYVVQDAHCGLGEAATKEECEAKGGVWSKWGLLGAEYCQIPSSDGGKPCLDGSECSLGGCISVSGELPGQCTRFKNIFGCFSFVENGEAGEIICVD